MKSIRQIFHRSRRGFTLTELMIGATIMGLVAVGIIAFLQQGLKMYYMDRARLMINRDIRTFTSQMETDAVTANFFCLYSDFATAIDGVVKLPQEDGLVGDFLLLVYTDPSQTTQGVSLITKLVGYYREVTNTTLNTGPVHRFEIPIASPYVNTTSAAGQIYTLLQANVTHAASYYPIVTQLAQGLAINTTGIATPTPALFYNFRNHSVMVDTQISESLTEHGTNSQTGNTYNFSVSPRG